jgi:hypothetical protein
MPTTRARQAERDARARALAAAAAAVQEVRARRAAWAARYTRHLGFLPHVTPEYLEAAAWLTYAITDGESVKVGRSLGHPVRRLHDLQTACPTSWCCWRGRPVGVRRPRTGGSIDGGRGASGST